MIAAARAVARAYPTMLRVGLAAALAYRAEMIVWMLTTTMPLVSLALWHAVAAAGGPGATIGGFGQSQLTAYFLAGLVVRQLTGSWVVWEINEEIRSGQLSLRLLRPIHPLWSYSARSISALPLRGAISLPIAVALFFIVGSSSFSHDPVILAALVASLLGGQLITYLLMAAIGALGFFMESSTAVFEVYLGLFFVLSGYTIPLEFFHARAPWVPVVARHLPFYYTLGFPIELALNQHPDRAEALRLLAVEWGWVAVFLVAALALWRVGLKRWNAYGA
jgi:ABC-2 type transport system permease protein